MASKREQIMDHVAGLLAGTTSVGNRIFRSRVEAFQRAEAPAIIVEPGPDRAAAPSASNCYIDWTFNLIVAVYARGRIPDLEADPIIVDLHNRIMSDRGMGGLAMDTWPDSFEPSFEKADRPSVWFVLSYRIRYRTRPEDLEV